jgi:hypothetical protein
MFASFCQQRGHTERVCTTHYGGSNRDILKNPYNLISKAKSVSLAWHEFFGY